MKHSWIRRLRRLTQHREPWGQAFLIVVIVLARISRITRFGFLVGMADRGQDDSPQRHRGHGEKTTKSSVIFVSPWYGVTCANGGRCKYGTDVQVRLDCDVGVLCVPSIGVPR
jgi:hypothetical protein